MIQRTSHNISFALPTSADLQAKLPAVLTRLRAKYGTTTSSAGAGLGANAASVTIEALTTRKTNTTTFLLKGNNEKTLAQVKKELIVALAKNVSVQVLIPTSLRAYVIGAKGKNLKAITDQTGVKINIPKQTADEAGAAPAPTGGDNKDDDYENEEQIPVTIDGDEFNARTAQSLIQALVAERTSKITQRLTNIEAVFYPFISGPKGANAAKLESQEQLGNGQVSVRVPPRAAFFPPQQLKDAAAGEEEQQQQQPPRERDLSIVVTGDRTAVGRVVAALESQVSDMRRSFRTLAIQIPKRQHRLLVGENAQEVLASTGCSIELAPQDDPSDSVTIRGPSAQLANGLTAVMTKANSVAVETVDLVAAHRDVEHARRLLRWLQSSGKLRNASAGGVAQIYAPREAMLDKTGQAAIEIVGGDSSSPDVAKQVADARSAVEKLVNKTTPACVKVIQVDQLVHRYIIGRKGANLKQYEAKNVFLTFPQLSEAAGPNANEVHLVFFDEAALDSGIDRNSYEAKAKEALQAVEEEVAKASVHAADLQTETLSVPAKFHRHILGPSGTTLNAIIGEEKLVAVNLGSTSRDAGATAGAKKGSESEDQITVRGPSAEVARVVKDLKRIAQEAEEDSIVNGHIVTLQLDQAHVRHIVGKGGAAVTKLREELGVRIDFSDSPGAPAAAAESGKKGKSSSAAGGKATCTLTGRKENVEQAAKRLRGQIEKLDDETSATIRIPVNLHGQIIGQGGKYVTRLQDTYAVRINFPGSNSTGGEQRPDEVVIKGGKKGVEGAKGV